MERAELLCPRRHGGGLARGTRKGKRAWLWRIDRLTHLAFLIGDELANPAGRSTKHNASNFCLLRARRAPSTPYKSTRPRLKRSRIQLLTALGSGELTV